MEEENKKADEPIRVKVAEAETLVPSSEREFSFISKPLKRRSFLSELADRLTVLKYMPGIFIIVEISLQK